MRGVALRSCVESGHLWRVCLFVCGEYVCLCTWYVQMLKSLERGGAAASVRSKGTLKPDEEKLALEILKQVM